MTRLPVSQKQGFSYIELLISLLIISSSFIAYSELIIRVKSTQLYLIAEFQQLLLTDYIVEDISKYRGFCSPSSALPTDSILGYSRND